MDTFDNRARPYSRQIKNNHAHLRLRVVTESGDFRYARSALDAFARELHHLIGKQLLRSDLPLSSSPDRSKVTRGDGRSLDPLGYPTLGNPDCMGQLVLTPGNRNSTLDSFHRQKISAAYGKTQQRRWWPGAHPSISVANVPNQDAKRAKPTQADTAAAKRLKEAWLTIPRDRRPTQEQLAERWGDGGSQSLISQYLGGVIPLNLRATMFFAREFDIDPRAIYPELPGLGAAMAEPRNLDEDDLDREWRAYPRELKQQIVETVRKAQGAQVRPKRKGKA